MLKRIFSEGFRVFFLATPLIALLTIGLWEALLWRDLAGTDLPALPFAPLPAIWHAHEMVFGFAAAAVGGFFLTAVPNWTGTKAAPQRFITVVALLWLAGRIAVFFSASLPAAIVALATLAFIPVLAAKLLTQLIKRPKPQNILLLAVLMALWAGEVLVQADWLGFDWGDAARGLRVGILALAAMVLVIGGRVTPAFTRNAMIREGRETDLPETPARLEKLGIFSGLALPFWWLLDLPAPLLGLLTVLAGGAALARLVTWRTGFALRQPILWTLHLSYGTLGLGLIVLGLSQIGWGNEISALHLVAIGGVAGMVVSVMTRASLGHTGRPLVAPRPVVLAYALLPLAALLRFADVLAPDLRLHLALASGIVWIAAFALVLAALIPILVMPRAPRAPVGQPVSQ